MVFEVGFFEKYSDFVVVGGGLVKEINYYWVLVFDVSVLVSNLIWFCF